MVKSLSSPPASQYWAILGPTYAWRATQISILGERFDLQVGTVGSCSARPFQIFRPNVSNIVKSCQINLKIIQIKGIENDKMTDRRWDHSSWTTPTIWHTTKGGKHIASAAETVKKADSESFCISLQTYDAKWAVNHFGPDPSRIARSNFCLRISKLLYLALRCFSQGCMLEFLELPDFWAFLAKPASLELGYLMHLRTASKLKPLFLRVSLNI